MQVVSAHEFFQVRDFRAVGQKVPPRVAHPERCEFVVVDEDLGRVGRI